MAGRLYKLQSKHTSNSGFDQTFMPCSGYILFAAEQQAGHHISWVDIQREVPYIVGWHTAWSKLSVKSVGLPIARGKLVCEFNFHKEGVNLHCSLYNAINISFSKKLAKIKRPKVKTSLIG